jgi:hypothetical protein
MREAFCFLFLKADICVKLTRFILQCTYINSTLELLPKKTYSNVQVATNGLRIMGRCRHYKPAYSLWLTPPSSLVPMALLNLNF